MSALRELMAARDRLCVLLDEWRPGENWFRLWWGGERPMNDPHLPDYGDAVRDQINQLCWDWSMARISGNPQPQRYKVQIHDAEGGRRELACAFGGLPELALTLAFVAALESQPRPSSDRLAFLGEKYCRDSL